MRFKKIFYCTITFISLINFLFAQNINSKDVQILQENIKSFLDEDDEDFKTNTIPAKWKTESGVIIAQKTSMLYDKRGEAGKGILKNLFLRSKPVGKIIVAERERKKIMLSDKFAVSLYSELYFRRVSEDDGFAARVIHPNGNIDEVDLTRSVFVDDPSDVPGRFKAYNARRFNAGTNKGYYKVPVADLQPGDIIEYAYLVFNNIEGIKGVNYFEFEPIYFSCNREFNVMKQKFEVKTDSETFLNSKSINSAPEFNEATEDEFNVYTWKDADREKNKDTRFVNERLVLPLVKFQVVYSTKEFAKNLFISSRGELKTSITPEELAQKANSIYGRYIKNDALSNEVNKILEQMNASNFNDEKYIQTVYYLFRHLVGMDDGINSSYFAYRFKQKLDERKIPCDIVVTAPNNVTGMDDVIFKEELEWCVKIYDRFVFNVSPNSNIYEIPEYALGNNAFVIVLGKNPEAKPIAIPISQHEENVSTEEVDAAFDASFENLNVNFNRSFKGLSRLDYIDVALAYTDAYLNDFKNYGGTNDLQNLSDKRQEEYYAKMTEFKKNNKEKKPILMKKQIEAQFSKVVRYNYFRLMSDGRSIKKPELKYVDNFILGDFVKKAGQTLIVPIPSLIEGQLQIKGDERERKFDIDVRYPRTLNWTIRFTVPAGYVAEGLDDLNVDVTNETGSFVSNAKLQGNILVITATKIYKQRNLKKTDWVKMLEWIDAAYNFSQKKVALKKAG